MKMTCRHCHSFIEIRTNENISFCPNCGQKIKHSMVIPWILHLFSFNGRASRAEYWIFVLAMVLLVIVGGLVYSERSFSNYFLNPDPFPLKECFYIFTFILFILCIPVTVRRLHDIKKSAWWLLLLIIFPIGIGVLLILMMDESQPGDNEYGKGPGSRCMGPK